MVNKDLKKIILFSIDIRDKNEGIPIGDSSFRKSYSRVFKQRDDVINELVKLRIKDKKTESEKININKLQKKFEKYTDMLSNKAQGYTNFSRRYKSNNQFHKTKAELNRNISLKQTEIFCSDKFSQDFLRRNECIDGANQAYFSKKERSKKMQNSPK